MKKIIATLALSATAVSVFAAGGSPCTGAATGGQATIAAGATFVKNAFTQKCSNNVYLTWKDDATTMAVGSGSAKGLHVFGGGSNGGGISAISGADCAASGCVASDASTGADTAYTAATSS